MERDGNLAVQLLRAVDRAADNWGWSTLALIFAEVRTYPRWGDLPCPEVANRLRAAERAGLVERSGPSARPHGRWGLTDRGMKVLEREDTAP